VHQSDERGNSDRKGVGNLSSNEETIEEETK